MWGKYFTHRIYKTVKSEAVFGGWCEPPRQGGCCAGRAGGRVGRTEPVSTVLVVMEGEPAKDRAHRLLLEPVHGHTRRPPPVSVCLLCYSQSLHGPSKLFKKNSCGNMVIMSPTITSTGGTLCWSKVDLWVFQGSLFCNTEYVVGWRQIQSLKMFIVTLLPVSCQYCSCYQKTNIIIIFRTLSCLYLCGAAQ